MKYSFQTSKKKRLEIIFLEIHTATLTGFLKTNISWTKFRITLSNRCQSMCIPQIIKNKNIAVFLESYIKN